MSPGGGLPPIPNQQKEDTALPVTSGIQSLAQPKYDHPSQDPMARMQHVAQIAPVTTQKNPHLAFALSNVPGDYAHAAQSMESGRLLHHGMGVLLDHAKNGTINQHLDGLNAYHQENQSQINLHLNQPARQSDGGGMPLATVQGNGGGNWLNTFSDIGHKLLSGARALDNAIGITPESVDNSSAQINARPEEFAKNLTGTFRQLPGQYRANQPNQIPWYYGGVLSTALLDIWDTWGIVPNLASTGLSATLGDSGPLANPLAHFVTIKGGGKAVDGYHGLQVLFNNPAILAKVWQAEYRRGGAAKATAFAGTIVLTYALTALLTAKAPEIGGKLADLETKKLGDIIAEEAGSAATDAASSATKEAGAAANEASGTAAKGIVDEAASNVNAGAKSQSDFKIAQLMEAADPVFRGIGQAFALVNKMATNPALLAAYGVGDVVAMTMFPQAWHDATAHDQYIDPITKQPVSVGSALLTLGGSKNTDLQGTWAGGLAAGLNGLSSLAIPDPLGAAGRVMANAKSAEGLGGILNNRWGGTLINEVGDPERIYGQYRSFASFVDHSLNQDALTIFQLGRGNIPMHLCETLADSKTVPEFLKKINGLIEAKDFLPMMAPTLGKYSEIKTALDIETESIWRNRWMRFRNAAFVNVPNYLTTAERMGKIEYGRYQRAMQTISEDLPADATAPQRSEAYANQRAIQNEWGSEQATSLLKDAYDFKNTLKENANLIVQRGNEFRRNLFSDTNLGRLWDGAVAVSTARLVEMDNLLTRLPTMYNSETGKFSDYNFPVHEDSLEAIDRALKCCGLGPVARKELNGMLKKDMSDFAWAKVFKQAEERLLTERLNLRMPEAHLQQLREMIIRQIGEKDVNYRMFGGVTSGTEGNFGGGMMGKLVNLDKDGHPDLGLPYDVAAYMPSGVAQFHFPNFANVDRAIRGIRRQTVKFEKALRKEGVTNLMDKVLVTAEALKDPKIVDRIHTAQLAVTQETVKMLKASQENLANKLRIATKLEMPSAEQIGTHGQLLTDEELAHIQGRPTAQRDLAEYLAMRKHGNITKYLDQLPQPQGQVIAPKVFDEQARAYLEEQINIYEQQGKMYKNMKKYYRTEDPAGELLRHPLAGLPTTRAYGDVTTIEQALRDIEHEDSHNSGAARGARAWADIMDASLKNAPTDFHELVQQYEDVLAKEANRLNAAAIVLNRARAGAKAARNATTGYDKIAADLSEEKPIPNVHVSSDSGSYMDGRSAIRDAIDLHFNDHYFKPFALATGGWAFRVSLSEIILNTFRIGPINMATSRLAQSVERNKYLLDQGAKFWRPQAHGIGGTLRNAPKATWPVVSVSRQTLMGMQRYMLYTLKGRRADVLMEDAAATFLRNDHTGGPSGIRADHTDSLMDHFAPMGAQRYDTKAWEKASKSRYQMRKAENLSLKDNAYQRATAKLLGPPEYEKQGSPLAYFTDKQPLDEYTPRASPGRNEGRYREFDFTGPSDVSYPTVLTEGMSVIANDVLGKQVAKALHGKTLDAATGVGGSTLLTQHAAEVANQAAHDHMIDSLIAKYKMLDYKMADSIEKQLQQTHGNEMASVARSYLEDRFKQEWGKRHTTFAGWNKDSKKIEESNQAKQWVKMRDDIEKYLSDKAKNEMTKELTDFTVEAGKTNMPHEEFAEKWEELRTGQLAKHYANEVERQMLESASNPWIQHVPSFDPAQNAFVYIEHAETTRKPLNKKQQYTSENEQRYQQLHREWQRKADHADEWLAEIEDARRAREAEFGDDAPFPMSASDLARAKETMSESDYAEAVRGFEKELRNFWESQRLHEPTNNLEKEIQNFEEMMANPKTDETRAFDEKFQNLWEEQAPKPEVREPVSAEDMSPQELKHGWRNTEPTLGRPDTLNQAERDQAWNEWKIKADAADKWLRETWAPGVERIVERYYSNELQSGMSWEDLASKKETMSESDYAEAVGDFEKQQQAHWESQFASPGPTEAQVIHYYQRNMPGWGQHGWRVEDLLASKGLKSRPTEENTPYEKIPQYAKDDMAAYDPALAAMEKGPIVTSPVAVQANEEGLRRIVEHLNKFKDVNGVHEKHIADITNSLETHSDIDERTQYVRRVLNNLTRDIGEIPRNEMMQPQSNPVRLSSAEKAKLEAYARTHIPLNRSTGKEEISEVMEHDVQMHVDNWLEQTKNAQQARMRQELRDAVAQHDVDLDAWQQKAEAADAWREEQARADNAARAIDNKAKLSSWSERPGYDEHIWRSGTPDKGRPFHPGESMRTTLSDQEIEDLRAKHEVALRQEFLQQVYNDQHREEVEALKADHLARKRTATIAPQTAAVLPPVVGRPQYKLRDDALEKIGINPNEDPINPLPIDSNSAVYKGLHEYYRAYQSSLIRTENGRGLQLPKSVQDKVRDETIQDTVKFIEALPERVRLKMSRNTLHSAFNLGNGKASIEPGVGMTPIQDWADCFVRVVQSMYTAEERTGGSLGNAVKNALGTTEDSPFMHFDLLTHMAHNTVPSAAGLMNDWSERFLAHPEGDIPLMKQNHLFPQGVAGRTSADINNQDVGISQWFTRILDRTHMAVLAPTLNWMAREPIWLYEYSQAMDKYRALISKGEMTKDQAAVLAEGEAVKKMIRFVHNPEDKLRIEKIIQWASPFYFAKNQAWRRTFRTLGENPGAFEQYAKCLMLTQNWVHVQQTKNQTNMMVFPGSGILSEYLTKALKLVPGHGEDIAMNEPWNFGFSSLATVFPGVDPADEGAVGTGRAVAPDAGPALLIPMQLYSHVTGWSGLTWIPGVEKMHGITDAAFEKIAGPIGWNMPLWADFVPNSIARNVMRGVAAATGFNLFNMGSSVVSTRANVENSQLEGLQHQMTQQLLNTGNTGFNNHGSVDENLVLGRAKLTKEEWKQRFPGTKYKKDEMFPMMIGDVKALGGKEFWRAHPDFAMNVGAQMASQWIERHHQQWLDSISYATAAMWISKTLLSGGLPVATALAQHDAEFKAGPDGPAAEIKKANGNVLQGLDNFQRKNPGKVADIISTTISPKGSGWGETDYFKKALTNPDFIKKAVVPFPNLAIYLLPPAPANDRYNPATYKLEEKYGFRHKASIDEHDQQIYKALGWDWYFNGPAIQAKHIHDRDPGWTYEGKNGPGAASDFINKQVSSYNFTVNSTWKFGDGASLKNAQTVISQLGGYAKQPSTNVNDPHMQNMLTMWKYLDEQQAASDAANLTGKGQASKNWKAYCVAMAKAHPESARIINGVFMHALSFDQVSPTLKMPETLLKQVHTNPKDW